ncbi:hypothetical protein ACN6AT_08265 [Streptomyces sp. JL4002]|uniref:hypothetical protein n=1 Tax=Streptomyces TaxID=1883 RepID=UPI003430A654
MKFTRFLCAAALAAGIAGGLTAGAASVGDSGSATARATAPCTPKPGDTEWTNPATHCPPSL